MENEQFKVQLLCSNSILGRFIVYFGLNALKRVGIKRCITNCSKWTKLCLLGSALLHIIANIILHINRALGANGI